MAPVDPAERIRTGEKLSESLVKQKGKAADVSKGPRPFNRNWQELADGLGFGNVADCKKWVNERIFNEHWQTYVQEFLAPERAKAARENRPVQRGPSLVAVQKRLEAGESYGITKYSQRTTIDKTNWDEADHLALLLYNLVEESTNNRNGPFYGTRQAKPERQFGIWQAILRVKSAYADSKIKRAQSSANKKALVSGALPARKRARLSIEREPSLFTTREDRRKRAATKAALAKVKKNVNAEEIEDDVDGDGEASNGSADDLGQAGLDRESNEDDMAPERDAGNPAHIRWRKRKRAEDNSDLNNEQAPRDISRSESEQGGSAIGQPEPDRSPSPSSSGTSSSSSSSSDSSSGGSWGGFSGGDQADDQENVVVSAGQRMSDEMDWDQPSMNLDERGWRYVAIREIVRAAHFADIGYLEDVVGYSNERLSAESLAWLREVQNMIAGRMITAGPITPNDVQNFRAAEERLDTQATQRINIREAADGLGLGQTTKPRLVGMPRAIWLRPWQPVAIYSLLGFETTLRGAMLCDAMGLGKTIQMIGHILAHNRKRAMDIARDVAVLPARPHLFCVPPHLVCQVMSEIVEFTEDIEVYDYWKDSRPKIAAGITPVHGLLSKDHEVFFGNGEDICKRIIVTSHQTFAIRHGPSALRNWRVAECGWEEHRAKKNDLVPDRDWPQDLQGMIDVCWVDEAHCIKRADSHTSVAIQWLAAEFTGLSTATPAINRVEDWRGYLKFIKPREDWEDPQVQEIWEIDATVNPYGLPKEHPGANLRLTEQAAEKWIFKNEDEVAAGYNLGKLQEMCMIRRTYASKINGQSIGSALPGLIRRHVELEFKGVQIAKYENASRRPLKKLVTVLRDGRIAWNAKHYRTLVLITLWQGFEHVAPHVYAQTMSYWKSRGNMLYEWLEILHAAAPDFEMPARDDHIKQIGIVCQQSPKMCAILALVAEEVAKHEEKMVTWCLFPAAQLLVWDILNKLHFDARTYSSDLTQDMRNEIVYDFNHNDGAPHILICSPSMSAYGLNLQSKCSRVLHVDEPMSRAVRDQEDHRCRRIGGRKDVLSYDISMNKTFNSRQILNNVGKAIPGLMAELNHSIFEIGVDDNGQSNPSYSIGSWVIVDQILMRADDPRAATVPEEWHLDPIDVLKKILLDERGEWVDIDMSGGLPNLEE